MFVEFFLWLSKIIYIKNKEDPDCLSFLRNWHRDRIYMEHTGRIWDDRSSWLSRIRHRIRCYNRRYARIGRKVHDQRHMFCLFALRHRPGLLLLRLCGLQLPLEAGLHLLQSVSVMLHFHLFVGPRASWVSWCSRVGWLLAYLGTLLLHIHYKYIWY